MGLLAGLVFRMSDPKFRAGDHGLTNSPPSQTNSTNTAGWVRTNEAWESAKPNPLFLTNFTGGILVSNSVGHWLTRNPLDEISQIANSAFYVGAKLGFQFGQAGGTLSDVEVISVMFNNNRPDLIHKFFIDRMNQNPNNTNATNHAH